ncbi:MAG TPA: 2'-5' RNA ligase family protein [Actinocrinis sp.]|nr:2'-5' RNA ligase family protein [Actinocrinis sp.]
MEPFLPPTMVWPPGETRWHCYALPDRIRDPALADLIDRTRAAALAAAADALAPVEDQWAHATVHMISRPAAELAPGAVQALASTLTRSLAGLPAFRLPAGSASAGTGSVLLGLNEDVPGRPWNTLSGLVDQAIGAHFGPRAQQYRPPPPHLSMAYCAKPTDTAAIESSLQTVRAAQQPTKAWMTINEVYLVDVHQDAIAHTYTWNKETAIRIPLA